MSSERLSYAAKMKRLFELSDKASELGLPATVYSNFLRPKRGECLYLKAAQAFQEVRHLIWDCLKEGSPIPAEEAMKEALCLLAKADAEDAARAAADSTYRTYAERYESDVAHYRRIEQICKERRAESKPTAPARV
jgi:hypothetical protein